jgi:hypothetical protein
MSVPPPGENGTIRLMGRSGYPAACVLKGNAAVAARASAAAMSRTRGRAMGVVSMSLLFFGVNLRWQTACAAKNQRAAVMLLWVLRAGARPFFRSIETAFDG